MTSAEERCWNAYLVRFVSVDVTFLITVTTFRGERYRTWYGEGAIGDHAIERTSAKGWYGDKVWHKGGDRQGTAMGIRVRTNAVHPEKKMPRRIK